MEIIARNDNATSVESTTNAYTLAYNANSAIAYARMFAECVNSEQFSLLSADCTNFVSQCVWAGFGGSNNSISTSFVYPMHSSGTSLTTDKWFYKTSANYSSPWSGTLSIWDYATIQNGNNPSCTPTTNRWESTQISCTIGTMPTMDYKGTILIAGQGSAGNYAHAIFATTGTTASTIRACAHNGYAKDKPLSWFGWGNNEPIHIIKPTIYVFSKTSAYGTINYRNNFVYGSIGSSLLHSGADVTGTSIYKTIVSITAVNTSTPVYSTTVYNSSYYSFYHTYTAVGWYNIKVTLYLTSASSPISYTAKSLII